MSDRIQSPHQQAAAVSFGKPPAPAAPMSLSCLRPKSHGGASPHAPALRPLLACALGLTPLASRPAAGAAALELDALQVTATKIERPLALVTDAVSIVTEQDIRTRNVTDTTEVLRALPGVQFKQTGGRDSSTIPSCAGSAVAISWWSSLNAVAVDSGGPSVPRFYEPESTTTIQRCHQRPRVRRGCLH
ncbi:MAG: hypothetical protein EA400_08560 [Chromatiaceae bacterium]|nr:MAG: hypothetical protein EA400_08560 [Chromatiaceae bacterium]